jgi:hypothetical protein
MKIMILLIRKISNNINNMNKFLKINFNITNFQKEFLSFNLNLMKLEIIF